MKRIAFALLVGCLTLGTPAFAAKHECKAAAECCKSAESCSKADCCKESKCGEKCKTDAACCSHDTKSCNMKDGKSCCASTCGTEKS